MACCTAADCKWGHFRGMADFLGPCVLMAVMEFLLLCPYYLTETCDKEST